MTAAPADKDGPSIERQGLFPCDAEVAYRLSMSADKFRRIIGALELQGFPRRDVTVGRRYWPAVVDFWNKRYGVGSISSRPAADGEENLDAF